MSEVNSRYYFFYLFISEICYYTLLFFSFSFPPSSSDSFRCSFYNHTRLPLVWQNKILGEWRSMGVCWSYVLLFSHKVMESYISLCFYFGFGPLWFLLQFPFIFRQCLHFQFYLRHFSVTTLIIPRVSCLDYFIRFTQFYFLITFY